MKKIFFIPDCHVPHEDKAAFNLMLKALAIFKPDIVVILGDFADFYAVSDHDKDPRRKLTFADEIDQANKRLREVEQAAGEQATKMFFLGNQEYRLERFLTHQAPQLIDMMFAGTDAVLSADGLLRLQPNGWKVYPYHKLGKVGHLYITHDAGYAGINAQRQTGAVVQGNIVFGHTHQLTYTVEGNMKGKKHVAMSCGWLGDPDDINYKSPAYVARYWAHGFGVGYLRDNGDVHLVPIPIVNKTVYLEGKKIT